MLSAAFPVPYSHGHRWFLKLVHSHSLCGRKAMVLPYVLFENAIIAAQLILGAALLRYFTLWRLPLISILFLVFAFVVGFYHCPSGFRNGLYTRNTAFYWFLLISAIHMTMHIKDCKSV